MPVWFARKLLDERFPAVTNTIYAADGRFSVNEGPTGMDGCLGTLDQRTCSGGYWSAFFPELDRVELDLFRRCQRPDGAPSHDIGFASFEERPTELNWPDLAASCVIQVHRHWLATGDRGFLREHWPGLERAVRWASSLDDTGRGVPLLRDGRGTTYDNQHWNGIGAFCSTMHQAALALGAELAEDMGEAETAQAWREGARKAAETRIRSLWREDGEGGYFRNAFDPASGKADDSCFIGSLAGDWAIAAAGLDPLLPPELIRKTLRNIMRLNVGDRGMTDQSARTDTRAFMQYPVAYVEATALLAGEPELAWRFLERQDEIVCRPPSSHFNQTLTYTWEGEAAGLPYCMTAPASIDPCRQRIELLLRSRPAPRGRAAPVAGGRYG